jgi:cytoskeletal protein RodZ
MKPLSTRKKQRNRIALAVISILLVTAGAALAYLYYQSSASEDSTTNYSEPSSEEKKGESTAEQNEPVAPTVKENVDQNQHSETNAPKNVGVTITTANQNENTVQIRAIIDILTNDGRCTLTMSKQGQPDYTITSDIKATASYSVCEGFDINSSKLSKGTWSVKVEYTNDKDNLKGAANDSLVVS